ncbi:YcfL family protein [Dongshaea marina]|uniref:YcfL family protein n=1 Tax=Dongshaea marina TaxID=2047966 RepID=UPI000D3ECAEB|nr:YcfL family protein [Dongshaea marina]
MIKGLIFAALTALLITGCSSNTSGIEGGLKPYTKVSNSWLGGQVVLSDYYQRKVGGILQATAKLTNEDSSDQNLQYRFVWFDNEGFPVAEEQQSWQPITLHGNQSIALRATAPTTSVASFKVSVREVND